MIADTLKNLTLYKDLPFMKEAVEYIRTHDINKLPLGRTDISDTLYVAVSEVAEKDKSEAILEAHNEYADLQVVFRGGESMGYISRDELGEIVSAKPEVDCYFYDQSKNDQIAWLGVKPGMFAVFLPEDAHAPGVALGDDRSTVKAVFKIKM